jgi:hypothetical protein
MARGCWVVAVLLLAGAAARAEDASEVYYRYLGPSGRPVFVNGLERVPAEHRKHARRLDLSKVSLNTELGAALRAEVDREYATLKQRISVAKTIATDVGLGAAPSSLGVRAWLGRLWTNHKLALAVAGALVVVMLFARPLGRRLGGGRLAWVLLLVTPAVIVFGLLSFTAMQVEQHNRQMARFVRAQEREEDDRYLHLLGELRAALGARPAAPDAGWVHGR